MKFDESRSNGPHAELAKLVGEWSGPTKTWFEPDVVVDESPMTGKMTAILGGRYIMHEYTGAMQGKPFEGVAIYGFDLSTNKFQTAWVDSFHTANAIMFFEGDAGEKSNGAGTYYTGPDTPRWGWRTEIEITDGDNIVLTAFNITPEGEETKATETRYTRKN